MAVSASMKSALDGAIGHGSGIVTGMDETVTGAEAIVLIAMLVLGITILAYTIRTGVPPMPTSPGTRAVMLRLLPQQIDGVIYDLGSGWGGLALAIAKRYQHNQVVGIELSPIPWLFARARLAMWPRPNLTYRRADLLGERLYNAGAIVCYLMPRVMQKLAPKLDDELRPGTVVVAYSFAVNHWRPDTVAVEAESGPAPIYRYTVGSPGR